MKLQARKHVLSDACLQRTFFIHYIQSGEGITPGVAGVLFSSDHRENDPGLGHAVFFLPWRRFTSLHFDRSSSRYVSVFGERKGLFFFFAAVFGLGELRAFGLGSGHSIHVAYLVALSRPSGSGGSRDDSDGTERWVEKGKWGVLFCCTLYMGLFATT
jgi:hypothetical protein